MADPWEVVARLRPRFADRAAESDRTGAFPVADFEDLRGAGLFGLMVPERLGGAGRGYADYARVAYELARGNGATALVFNMHASVTGALAGIPDDDRTTFSASVARRKGLTIVLVRRMKDVYPRAIALVRQGRVDVGGLVTARYPLGAVDEAFRVAAARAGLKVVVEPART